LDQAGERGLLLRLWAGQLGKKKGGGETVKKRGAPMVVNQRGEVLSGRKGGSRTPRVRGKEGATGKGGKRRFEKKM